MTNQQFNSDKELAQLFCVWLLLFGQQGGVGGWMVGVSVVFKCPPPFKWTSLIMADCVNERMKDLFCESATIRKLFIGFNSIPRGMTKKPYYDKIA